MIQDNYYRKVSERRLRDASVRGMVRSLRSRFSHYFTPAREPALPGVDQRRVLRRRHDRGRATGAGLLVAGVFEGSPAERAGIKPGDLITEVNGKSIAGKPSEVSTALIKGKPGTSVRLTIRGRAGGKRRDRGCGASGSRVPAVDGAMRRA